MRRVLVGILLLATAAIAARADEWNKQFSVTGKPAVVVTADDGSIQVTPTAQGQVRATVTTSGYRISEDDVRVEARQEGNRVEINIRKMQRAHVGIGVFLLRIELSVPKESDLELHTKDGRIEVSDLKGAQNLGSGDGRIEAHGLDGTLKADTRDGRINVDGRFDALTAHTGDGSIEATVRPGSRITNSWSLRTGDGSIRVQLPGDFAADLDAHTGDGHISCDLPLTVAGTYRSEGTVRGKLNAGGPTLELRTGDGSIRVTKF